MDAHKAQLGSAASSPYDSSGSTPAATMKMNIVKNPQA